MSFLTYSGQDINFRTLVNQYNHTAQLFLNPQTRNVIRARVFQNLIDQLLSIYRQAPLDWLNRTKSSSNGTGIGMVHLREILFNLIAIKQIVTQNNFPPLTNTQNDYVNQANQFIQNLTQIILNRENYLNRSFKNTVLQYFEFGAAVLLLAGLAVAGIGGILSGAGYLICSEASVGAGITTLKAGGVMIGGGFTGGIIANCIQETEPDMLRNMNFN